MEERTGGEGLLFLVLWFEMFCVFQSAFFIFILRDRRNFILFVARKCNIVCDVAIGKSCGKIRCEDNNMIWNESYVIQNDIDHDNIYI